ncbi:MAG TPA: alpha/beta fold hydrolase [Candidatus Hydrogenedentes bacterium]|nr:alpha/beta fold hydrolase [Candidatus Hydrogenedentota bacterium]HRT20180.1 alpha/beta fold hydrolase [Candidatus Hydrogenedentota bacterium]HRT63214.1 alpha/beta fold hydrolase [Candidatus Hydrogenedentota bacterium]
MSLLMFLILIFVAGAICWWVFSVHAFSPPISADEVHTITTPDRWHLRLCRHKAKSGPGEPVLMVHGFMSTQFNFSLPAGASMADALSAAGYDCWLIDLRGNSCAIPPFGHSLNDASMDDYLFKDIPTAIQYIRKMTGYEKVHWVGHSMGGMLLYAYDAVSGSPDLASGVTLGSPIGFHDVPFKRPGWAFGLRRSSRLAFRCGQRLLISICHFFKPQLAFLPINYENMNPILDAKAMFSTMDAPPLGVSESLAKAAESHVWRVKDESVDVFDHLKDLQVPLFAIFGAADPFVPVVHAETFFREIKIPDKRFLMLSKANGHAADYSHVDLVFGREAQKDVFDPVIEWLRAHAIVQRSADGVRPAAEVVEYVSPSSAPSKPKRRPTVKRAPKKADTAPKEASVPKANPAKKKTAPRKPTPKKDTKTK